VSTSRGPDAAASPIGEGRRQAPQRPHIVYLDQNAWVALARGAWDKSRFPREHEALSHLVERLKSEAVAVPLSFANIYETAKINDPARRENMARTQALVSGGRVFRGRRRILAETLAAYLARHFSIPRPEPNRDWFLSDLWFEAIADHSPQEHGSALSPAALDAIRADPAFALLHFLVLGDERARSEVVRRNSVASAGLIARIEARRALAAGEPLPMRRRIYGARVMLDELDFVLETGRLLGLAWHSLADLGSSLARNIPAEVPVLRAERELALRLEDQNRRIVENDLRDMAAFTTVLPFADVMVAEKPFVNLARQAHLDQTFGTTLLTSVFDLAERLDVNRPDSSRPSGHPARTSGPRS